MCVWIFIRKCLNENHAYGVRAKGLEFLLLFSKLQCLHKKSILREKFMHEIDATCIGTKGADGISSRREAKLGIWAVTKMTSPCIIICMENFCFCVLTAFSQSVVQLFAEVMQVQLCCLHLLP